MKNSGKGFTLIELIVVVLIIGILAAVAIPQYRKTVEVSKADAAVGLTHMIYSANKMYYLDNNSFANGEIEDNEHVLVARKYLAPQNWGELAYTFTSGSDCGTGIACSTRKNGTGDFADWGYTFDVNGGCSPAGGAPSCPKF